MIQIDYGCVVKYFLLVDFVKGFQFGLKYFFVFKVIVNYLYEKGLLSLCFCGEYVLCCYLNGEECCIVCKFCEVVCLVQVIIIDVELCEDGSCCIMCYDIDMIKCIYCGFC